MNDGAAGFDVETVELEGKLHNQSRSRYLRPLDR